MTALEPDEFRCHFPMLKRTAHLASCSLGARSTDLDAALAAMLEAMAQYGAPWSLFEEQLERARSGFARLVRARTDEVAVLPNASVGAYQVASTLDWSSRRRIVTSYAEFPSIAHVWLAQRSRGAEVTYVGTPDGRVTVTDYVSAIDAGTGLVSVPLTTYRDGVRLAVDEVVAAAHALGARVFVDAYQAVGTEAVRVGDLGCEWLVAGAMKYLLGLPGVAFLYCRLDTLAGRRPQLTGWFGRRDPLAFDPCSLDFADGARRFETGTPPIPSLYAANAGLSLIGEQDMAAVQRHIHGVWSYAADRLTAQGETVRMPPPGARHGAHLALVDRDAHSLASWLARRAVTVSPRHDVIRISIHYHTNAQEIDLLCRLISAYREGSSEGCPGDASSHRLAV